MNVFLSWSGDRSKRLASVLSDFLQDAIQNVTVWMSDQNIGAGSRWSDELNKKLEDSDFGVLCLTPENLSAPWLLFEAGSLAKSVSGSKVVPYCLGVALTDVPVPLAQFQSVNADKAGTKKLLQSLNSALDSPIDQPRLERIFGKWWPGLKTKIEAILPSENPDRLGIPSIGRFHGYSGEWKIMTKFTKWQDQPVDQNKGDRVEFAGSMFLLLSTDGHNGSGAQIGELHVSVDTWSATYRVANQVTSAYLAQDGSVHLFVHVFSRTRAKGDPPPPGYRDDLFGKGSCEVRLRPSSEWPTTLIGGHTYPSGYRQEAEEIYEYEGFVAQHGVEWGRA